MAITAIETGQHALYRFYDTNDQLLYIGVTANPGRRFGQHAGTKPWWYEVTNIRMERHPDRASVLTAERAAIQTERPAHNIVHAGGTAPTTPGELVTADDGQPGEWPVAPGDVVALGLTDSECPVGYVTHVTKWGPRLALLNFFWEGTFDAGDRTVAWHRVLEIRHARLKRADEIDPLQVFLLGKNAKVFHTEPLGDFQTGWTA